jgi:hypothetical protein
MAGIAVPRYDGRERSGRSIGTCGRRAGALLDMRGKGEVMGERKRRLTLGRMMAVIGIVALGFAMTRVDAAPAVSLCVFVGCTWYLAVRRFDETMARRAAEGAEISPSRKARIAARCAVIAAIAIGLPDAAFLGGLYGYMAVVRRFAVVGNAWRPDLDPAHILIGAIVGIAAALYVAAIMRGGFRTTVRRRRAPSGAADRTSARSLLKHGRVAAGRASAC